MGLFGTMCALFAGCVFLIWLWGEVKAAAEIRKKEKVKEIQSPLFQFTIP